MNQKKGKFKFTPDEYFEKGKKTMVSPDKTKGVKLQRVKDEDMPKPIVGSTPETIMQDVTKISFNDIARYAVLGGNRETLLDKNGNRLEFYPMVLHLQDGCAIFGVVSSSRIREEDIPNGLFKYSIRHKNDDDSVPCTIEASVRINHLGDFLCHEELIFNEDDGFFYITDWYIVS